MLRSAEFFKDETLGGISRAIKHLHQMQAEATIRKMENFGVTKNNPHFRNLLNHLDMALFLGLEDPHKGYWPMIKKVCHKTTVQMVESHDRSTDSIRRGQVWLFLTFIESSLVSYIKLVRGNKKLLKSHYKKYALLRDDERCEIFEQLLVGLEMIDFVLDFNAPFLGYEREPFFMPSEFYATKAVETAALAKDEKDGAVEPDITVGTQGDRARPSVTPDLLCKTTETSRRKGSKLNRKADIDDGNELVTHLRSKKREGNQRRKRISSRSESLSNELEDDNYIPEFQDSFPITVVVPDKPENLNTNLHEVASDPELCDETVYTNFLLEYSPESSRKNTKEDGELAISLGNEIENLDLDENEQDPRIDPPVTDVLEDTKHVTYADDVECIDGSTHDKEKDSREEDPLHDEINEDEQGIIASSYHSEDAYRITYVSDDEAESGSIKQKQRSQSLDSYDRFCRSGSVGKDDKRKSVNDDDDEDDDEEDENIKLQISAPTETIEDVEVQSSLSHDISLDSDAITSSPMSGKLTKESVDKVLHARFDTSTGILLPTLPRRPEFSEACDIYQSTSLDQNALVLLSLEIHESPTEIFKKIFDVFVGYLYGIRKQATLLITNEYMYLLTREEKRECGYMKQLSVHLDSINRIQTGFNMQDVLVTHDTGKLHLWTGDEVETKHITLALSSELRSSEARSVSLQQMKVDVHEHLDVSMKDWLIALDSTQKPEIIHFGLVDFHSLSAQEPEQKVFKSGYLHHKQSYLGMVPYWDLAIFGLRGSSLYEYSSKAAHELKHIYSLEKCGGCVRVKGTDKFHAFKVLSNDGSTPMIELAAESEEDANDWIINICQVVAETKQGQEKRINPYTEGVAPRGLLLSTNKILIFVQDLQSGRLILIDSCTVQDVTQICVDNEDRSYCAVLIDDSIDSYLENGKRTWVLKFQSEHELGKFEQKVYAVWHSLYQVPLQFVLLADSELKRSIRRHLLAGKQSASFSIDYNEVTVSELASLR